MERKQFNIKTETGIMPVEILDKFTFNGRLFVVNHWIFDNHYHVVTDFLTGYMVGEYEHGIKAAKKKAIGILELHIDFDFSKYETINIKE